MEEDLEVLTAHGYSLKPKSPIYQRKFIDPLGISADRGSRRGTSKESLSEMFPHGQLPLLSETMTPFSNFRPPHAFAPHRQW